MVIYHQLTKAFNAGRTRAVLCSGQAVVMHRLAITSKDGDWIVREDEADLAHVREMLAGYGATYRFGAPLDPRWLAAGWSAHLEFRHEGLRVRTDFFSRPPRLTPQHLDGIWAAAESAELPFTGLRELALMKMTMREKDYPIIGELARRMECLEDQLLFSRSARDLLRLAADFPETAAKLVSQRPVLAKIREGEDKLAAALDAERRVLIKADETRLTRYQHAAARWETAWPAISTAIAGRSLPEAHQRLCESAAGLLPTAV
jgi:hypothetical protein